MSEKIPQTGGESNEAELLTLQNELKEMQENYTAYSDILMDVRAQKEEAKNNKDHKEFEELKETEAGLKLRLKGYRKEIRHKRDLIIQKGGAVEELEESPEADNKNSESPLAELRKRLQEFDNPDNPEDVDVNIESEEAESLFERRMREISEEDVENVASETNEQIDNRASESTVDPEVIARVQHRAKSKVNWFSKKYNSFKEGTVKAKEFVSTKEGQIVVGKAGYDTATSIFGVKTFSDILLAIKGKGDIYNYFKQRSIRKSEMAQLNALAIEVEEDWQKRLAYANKRNKKAGNKKEDRQTYDNFHEDEKNAYEDASINVRNRLKEFYDIVDKSDNLTAEEKKEYRKKATRIMYERGKKEEPVTEKRDSTVAEATSVYLQTKVHGAKIVKDALNTTLMSTGLVGFRAAGYGLMSVVDRGISAKRQYAKDVELDYRKLRGVETTENQKDKVMAIVKDLTVNSTVETVRALSGRGKKEGSKHKKMEFVQAIGSVFRLVGIVGKDYDEILKTLDDVLEEGVVSTVGDNMSEKLGGITSIFASSLNAAEINGIGDPDLEIFSESPDSLLTDSSKVPINLGSINGINQDTSGFEIDDSSLEDAPIIEDVKQELKVDKFNKEHALFISEGDKDGFDINNDNEVVSATIKLGADGAYKNVDQALRRLVVDNMDISGDFDAVEAAKAENVLANIRELINGRSVAGMSSEDLKGIVSINEDGDLVIEDYNKFSDLNDKLFERANNPIDGITNKSDAIAYVDNTGVERWQEMVNAKQDAEAHVVHFNADDISKAEMKVFEQQYGEKFSFLGDEPTYDITSENDGTITINDRVYKIADGEVVSIDGNKLESPVKIDEKFQDHFMVEKIGADYNLSMESLKSMGIVSDSDLDISNVDKHYLETLNSKGLLSEEGIKRFAESGYHVDYFVKDGKFNNEAFQLLVNNEGKIDRASFDEILTVENALEHRVNKVIPLESIYNLHKGHYKFTIADNGDVMINMSKSSGFYGGIIITESDNVRFSSGTDALARVDDPRIIETERDIRTYISDKDRLGKLFEDLENKRYEHSMLADSMEGVVDEGRMSINMDRGYFEAMDELLADDVLWDKKVFINAMLKFGEDHEPSLKSVGQKDNLGKLYDEIAKTVVNISDSGETTYILPINDGENLREYLMRAVGERKLSDEELVVEEVVSKDLIDIKKSISVDKEALDAQTSDSSKELTEPQELAKELDEKVQTPSAGEESHDSHSHQVLGEHVLSIDGESANSITSLDGKKVIVKDFKPLFVNSADKITKVVQFEGRNVWEGVDDQGNVHYYTGDGDNGFNECKLPTDENSESFTNTLEKRVEKSAVIKDEVPVNDESKSFAQNLEKQFSISAEEASTVSLESASINNLVSNDEEAIKDFVGSASPGGLKILGANLQIVMHSEDVTQDDKLVVLENIKKELTSRIAAERGSTMTRGSYKNMIGTINKQIDLFVENNSEINEDLNSIDTPVTVEKVEMDVSLSNAELVQGFPENINDVAMHIGGNAFVFEGVGGPNGEKIVLSQMQGLVSIEMVDASDKFSKMIKSVALTKENYEMIRNGLTQDDVDKIFTSTESDVGDQLLNIETTNSLTDRTEEVIEDYIAENLPKVNALIKGFPGELDKSFQEAGWTDPQKRQLAVEYFMTKIASEDGKLSYEELLDNKLVTEDYQYSDYLVNKLLLKYGDDINNFEEDTGLADAGVNELLEKQEDVKFERMSQVWMLDAIRVDLVEPMTETKFNSLLENIKDNKLTEEQFLSNFDKESAGTNQNHALKMLYNNLVATRDNDFKSEEGGMSSDVYSLAKRVFKVGEVSEDGDGVDLTENSTQGVEGVEGSVEKSSLEGVSRKEVLKRLAKADDEIVDALKGGNEATKDRIIAEMISLGKLRSVLSIEFNMEALMPDTKLGLSDEESLRVLEDFSKALEVNKDDYSPEEYFRLTDRVKILMSGVAKRISQASELADVVGENAEITEFDFENLDLDTLEALRDGTPEVVRELIIKDPIGGISSVNARIERIMNSPHLESDEKLSLLIVVKRAMLENRADYISDLKGHPDPARGYNSVMENFDIFRAGLLRRDIAEDMESEDFEKLKVGIHHPKQPTVADNFNPDGTINLEIDEKNIPGLASAFESMGDKTKAAWVDDYNRLNHSDHTVSDMEEAIRKAANLTGETKKTSIDIRDFELVVEESSPISENLDSHIGTEYSVGKDGLDCMTLIKETGESVENDTLKSYVEFVNTHKGNELTFTAFLEGKDVDFRNADWETVKEQIEPGEYMVSLNSPGSTTYGAEGHGAILRVMENTDGLKDFTMVHASTSALMAEGLDEPVPLHELTIKIDGKEYAGRDIVENFKKDYGEQTKVLENGSKVYNSDLVSKMKLFDKAGNEIKPILLEDGSMRLGYVTKETDLDSYMKYNKDFSKDITVLDLESKKTV